MTIHLTIWWLWIPLIAIYGLGVIFGLMLSMLGDCIEWWFRPAILIWPLVLAGLLIWSFVLFMLGRD